MRQLPQSTEGMHTHGFIRVTSGFLDSTESLVIAKCEQPQNVSSHDRIGVIGMLP
jgi:hypothetical protein